MITNMFVELAHFLYFLISDTVSTVRQYNHFSFVIMAYYTQRAPGEDNQMATTVDYLLILHPPHRVVLPIAAINQPQPVQSYLYPKDILDSLFQLHFDTFTATIFTIDFFLNCLNVSITQYVMCVIN